MEVDLEHLFPKLDIVAEVTLRYNIKKHGLLVPILVDQNGDVLDGHHRKAICERYKIPLRTETRHCADDQERLRVAIEANTDRRHGWTDAVERDAYIRMWSTKYKMSNREIARAMRVSHSTVNKALRPAAGRNVPAAESAPEKRVGRDGRRHPAARTSPEQLARRRAEVAERIGRGETMAAIAAALGVGATVVSADRKALGIEPQPRRAGRPKPTKAPAPVRVEPSPPYLKCGAKSTMRTWVADFEDGQLGIDRLLADHLRQAEEAGDQAWLDDTRRLVDYLCTRMGRLRLLLDDRQLRHAAMTGAPIVDRPLLTVVPGVG